MKYLILHADGMADGPLSGTRWKDPSRGGRNSSLWIALPRAAKVGLLSLPSESGPTGSDVTNVVPRCWATIPKSTIPGPGPLEAAGLGITVGEQDVVFRCTMVTVRGGGASGSKEIL